MSKKQFIRENREELDKYIRKCVPNVGSKLDEEEMELWILNDEFLYNWMRREGVRV